MILKTLPELLEQKRKLDAEILNYDIKKIWTEILNKMHISTFDMDLSNDRLMIKIPNRYSIYSWYLPKGVYTIFSREQHTIIRINLNDETIEQARNNN